PLPHQFSWHLPQLWVVKVGIVFANSCLSFNGDNTATPSLVQVIFWSAPLIKNPMSASFARTSTRGLIPGRQILGTIYG
ncbi:hypothetical protein DFH29DRAFT_949693, partial [Suillus ampliporus]